VGYSHPTNDFRGGGDAHAPAFAWRKKPKRWPAITRRLFSLNAFRDGEPSIPDLAQVEKVAAEWE
jgi:hypothetical protein